MKWASKPLVTNCRQAVAVEPPETQEIRNRKDQIMNQNPTPNKSDQLREIQKAATTPPTTNTVTKTPLLDKSVSALEVETTNTLEHIKRLVIENQRALKEKPSSKDLASVVEREVEGAKREILAAIPVPPPASTVPIEPLPVGLRPGYWVALILVLVVVVAGSTAWETWQIHKLDQTIYFELSQVFKEIQKHEHQP